MGWWNHTLSQILPSSYQRKAVDGTTGGWFVIPVRAWHKDCKDLFYTDLKYIYVDLERHTKESVTDSNIE